MSSEDQKTGAGKVRIAYAPSLEGIDEHNGVYEDSSHLPSLAKSRLAHY
jgi:hypothetical protein